MDFVTANLNDLTPAHALELFYNMFDPLNM